MKRGPKELTGPFHKAGMRLPRVPGFIDRLPCCWLAPFDPEHRPCGGGLKWEAFHFIGKVAIRRVVGDFLTVEYDWPHGAQKAQDAYRELIELAEWDPRNAGPGCVQHHRRFDGLATPTLTVYRETLPDEVEEFIADWGLDCEAERKFPLRPLSPV